MLCNEFISDLIFVLLCSSAVRSQRQFIEWLALRFVPSTAQHSLRSLGRPLQSAMPNPRFLLPRQLSPPKRSLLFTSLKTFSVGNPNPKPESSLPSSGSRSHRTRHGGNGGRHLSRRPPASRRRRGHGVGRAGPQNRGLWRHEARLGRLHIIVL